MSLSALLNAVVEYAGDVLVNDCGRPEPDRMLRYHGNLPHDCCSDAGFLAIHWTDGRLNDPKNPCAGRPAVTLILRYVICWPEPDLVEGLPVITDAYDTQVNTKAGMLADVEDCMARALVRLGCERPAPNDPNVDAYVAAVWRNVAGTSLAFSSASPILPSGKCAGVEWRLSVAPLPGSVS